MSTTHSISYMQHHELLKLDVKSGSITLKRQYTVVVLSLDDLKGSRMLVFGDRKRNYVVMNLFTYSNIYGSRVLLILLYQYAFLSSINSTSTAILQFIPLFSSASRRQPGRQSMHRSGTRPPAWQRQRCSTGRGQGRPRGPLPSRRSLRQQRRWQRMRSSSSPLLRGRSKRFTNSGRCSRRIRNSIELDSSELAAWWIGMGVRRSYIGRGWWLVLESGS